MPQDEDGASGSGSTGGILNTAYSGKQNPAEAMDQDTGEETKDLTFIGCIGVSLWVSKGKTRKEEKGEGETGWIHAVYTPQDTLVFGGNFLHSFNIPMQLRIYSIEDRTRVPTKFRYPFYYEMCWYVLERYVYCMTQRSHLTKDFQRESLSMDLELSGRRRPDTPSSSSSSSSSSASSSSSSSSSENDDSSDQDWEEEEGLRKRERDRRKVERELQRRRNRERHIRERDRQRRHERIIIPPPPASHRPLTPPPSIPLPTPPSPPRAPPCLTWFEMEGLHCLVMKLESLPPHKKSVPDGIHDPDALLCDIKVGIY
ncbi:lysine-specific demethylase 2A-like [Bombina bombina]|uniref:lysine-specific demethylase 2A-like n=1 Tax=Bombina bombina TaxID=8345 RepID=UPI00235A83FA|nr:lysine-specific demethylase 2A-like [Bombina bombina]